MESDQARFSLERVEQQVGEEAVEFDQDAGCDREPDGGKHRGGGEELFHGWKSGELKRLSGAPFSGVKP